MTKENKLFLSRRNLLVLLSKLDRKSAGEVTECTLIKNQQPAEAYQQTMKSIQVIAVEDADYYGKQKRAPGVVLFADEPKIVL
jgi:hypothetical protein